MALPKYKVTIDPEYSEGEDLGIEMIAFTDDPAIFVKGMAFKGNKKKSVFKDEPKMRIVAPAMIPMEIYRNDGDDYEYYVEFTEQEIDAIHKKFMANLTNANIFNLEHNEKEIVPAYILEAWIVENPKEDKAYSSYGIEVPKGTLMLTAQVTDKDYYTSLIENDRVGFSIEGFLGLMDEQFKKEKYMVKLPDGEHLIEGKIYVVVDGEVTEIKDAEVAEEMNADEDPIEEEVAMESEEESKEEKEEEVAMESEEEEVEVEMAEEEADPDAEKAKIEAIVDEKLVDVLAMIAELKEEIAGLETVAPEAEQEMNMSAAHKFANLNKFLRNE